MIPPLSSDSYEYFVVVMVDSRRLVRCLMS